MEKLKAQSGFTMVELIIVVAIMGIIGAILVPQFSKTTEKARITTDINSVKAIQRQIDRYHAEFAKWPGNTPQTIMSELVLQNYIDASYVSGGNLEVGTSGAQMIFDVTQNRVKLKVSVNQYNLFLGQTEQLAWLTH